MKDPGEKRSPEELIRLALAAKDRAEQLRILDALVSRSYFGPQSMKTFQSLAASGGEGPRLALEFVARMPDPVPNGVLLLAAQTLPNRANPLPLCLAVAGKLLGSLPDSVQAVGPIVRSVTAGLSRSRTLERMIQLQSRVDRCGTLDAMVSASEARVKLKCPKCGVKLTRPELIVHLWKRHQLIFERGQVLDPRPIVEKVLADVATHMADKPPEAAYRDSANYFPQSRPLQVLQAVAARQRPAGGIPLSLVEAAGAALEYLCPVCLTPIADRLRPLPPLLAVTPTRIAGDGYSVQVTDTVSRQTVEVRTPGGSRSLTPVSKRVWGPRGAAVLVAGGFLAVSLGALWLAPPRLPPFGLAVLLALSGWGFYAAVRFFRPRLPGAGIRVFDVAWQEIVARLSPEPSAVRFLTRLCLTSIGRGSAGERSRGLRNLLVAAEVDPGPESTQLLASAQVLQVSDGTSSAKDKIQGLVNLFEPIWRVERPIDHAEYLAEIVATRLRLATGDAARLSTLLLDSVFEHGLLPQDILTISDYLPWLRMVLGLPTLKHLQMAYTVWRGKNSEPWASAGPAITIYDLARKSPATVRKILAACPDALLKLELPEGAQRTLGDVLLTPRGLVIGSALLADPNIAIDLLRSPRGSGWILKFGRELIALDRKIPPELLPVFSAWLSYRSQRLLPQAEAMTRANPWKVRKLLNPLGGICTLCGAESIGRSGKVGDPGPLENGGRAP